MQFVGVENEIAGSGHFWFAFRRCEYETPWLRAALPGSIRNAGLGSDVLRWRRSSRTWDNTEQYIPYSALECAPLTFDPDEPEAVRVQSKTCGRMTAVRRRARIHTDPVDGASAQAIWSE